MPLHFCPQCGSKVQPGFKFCPSCGEKLPCQFDAPETTSNDLFGVLDTTTCNSDTYGQLPLSKEVLPPVTNLQAVKSTACTALTRTPIQSSRRLSARKISSPSTPTKVGPNTDRKPLTSPLKRKASSEVKEEEQKNVTSPLCSPHSDSKAKRAKRLCVVEPVQEGIEFCDQSGKKWRLGRLLNRAEVELTYEVQQANVKSTSEWNHILKMGAKEGQLFNEQNFLLRAAKSVAVEKWVKKLNLDFLGIPLCVGFGLYETYRFLIFPDMGQTLLSVMDTEKEPLPERVALQLACRLLDALEFIHENEYAHADIHAGNIYTDKRSQVFLSGFGHAFRFCPGGKHVEYRDGSRSPHQGHLCFISLDSHKGAGPSRRSDLQSLGYCLLFWMTGILPWGNMALASSISAEKERYMTDIHGLVSYCFKKKKVSGALQSYLSHVMSLHYTEKPDYSLLRAGLNESLQKMGGTLGEPLFFNLS